MSPDQEILSESKPLVEPADAPGWAGKVWVREMSAEDGNAYELSRFRIEGEGENARHIMQLENLHARLLVKCLCHESGERIFKDEQAAALGAKLGRQLALKLYLQAVKLNGLDKESTKKNSAPTNDSSSGSPSPSANGTTSA